MPISRSTRTHFIYQFIILTLLFLSIGYHELLPDRKFILFLAFIPMFCYQFVILSYCTGLLSVPSWMNFEDSPRKTESRTEKNAQKSLGEQEVPDLQMSKKRTALTDYDNISSGCLFEPNRYTLRNWKKELDNIEIPSAFLDSKIVEQCRDFRTHESKHSLPRSRTFQTLDLESDFSKSYSFPFRQKRFGRLRKSKENLKQSNSFLNIPCQSSEYSAATDQEARRFNITVSKAETTKNLVDELTGQTEVPDLTRLESDGSNSTLDIKNLPFKPYTSKFSLGHMNKLKIEISNRFSRSRKQGKTENEDVGYKAGKRTPVFSKRGFCSTENISSEPTHKKGIRFYVRQKFGNKGRTTDISRESGLFQTENFEINEQKPAFRWYNENK
ncbi:uncharacterized protein LOC118205596 [Stegodyphus dumicola]|uniref:uncharacterized protein LOC118205596 n=1 Tax=Stegodyphus dumicola TaxID=202533 RepID=UPI0015B2DC5A|nr:uncharacterized protein LOC118205596 [Stegodyphus dumicola]